LLGATGDAVSFWKVLTNWWDVPLDHIGLLLDYGYDETEDQAQSFAATRDGIVNALYELRNNDNIQFGDMIVIYYAGNGSSYPTSDL